MARRIDQIWCCEKHRRKGQDERRIAERELRSERSEPFVMNDPWCDPWERDDLKDMSVEEIESLGALDPLPSGYHWDDFIGGPMNFLLTPKKKKYKCPYVQLLLI